MPEHIHDKGYKRLLSQKKNFLHFMKKYIRVNWIQNIAEDDLTLIDKAFVDENFKELEADLIYKVKNSDSEVIFYVLLELQSKCDHTMPFRLLVYMVELLKRLFYETPKQVRERKEFRMPAVIPVVLYNGKPPWTAVHSYRDYTAQPNQFEDSILDYKYLFLDILRLSETEILDETGNAPFDAVLYLEQNSKEESKLQHAIARIMQRAPIYTMEDINQVYSWLIDNLREMAKNSELVQEIEEYMKKGDLVRMDTAIGRLFEENRQKGIQLGEKKGREESQQEIARTMLKDGVEPKLVSRYTGIPLEKLYELKENSV